MGKTRNRRTRDERVPTHTQPSALAAAERIRRRRATARPPDPDLEFFPRSVVDDEDLAAVVDYLRTHQRVSPEVRRAELRDRAILIQYRWQRAEERHERDLLALLDAGHHLYAWPTVYGPPLGLHSRSHVWNVRNQLAVKYRENGIPRPTARETDRASRLADWLAHHRTPLLALAELLVDHRDSLADLLADPDARAELLETIDQAGQDMSARPTATFAASLAHAVFLLRCGGPAAAHPDPVVRDGLAQGVQLRAEFTAVAYSD